VGILIRDYKQLRADLAAVTSERDETKEMIEKLKANTIAVMDAAQKAGFIVSVGKDGYTFSHDPNTAVMFVNIERDGYAAELAEALAVKERAEARACGIADVLRQHHEWELDQTDEGSYGSIADAYAESELCEDTLAVLATASNVPCPHAVRSSELAAALEAAYKEACRQLAEPADWEEDLCALTKINTIIEESKVDPAAILRARDKEVAAKALRSYLEEQREFSERQFGPGPRTLGIIKHIKKELIEIEAEPTDLTEWVDVILLACDGYWRHGGKPENLLSDMLAKLAKNKTRTWPTPKDDEPVEHVREALADAEAQ